MNYKIWVFYNILYQNERDPDSVVSWCYSKSGAEPKWVSAGSQMDSCQTAGIRMVVVGTELPSVYAVENV